MQLTARDIARLVDGEVVGNADEPVTGVAGIREAEAGDVTFVAHPRYLAAAKSTRASVIVVARSASMESPHTLVRVENPSVAFAKIVEHDAPAPVKYKTGVHPSACVGKDVKFGPEVSIGAFAVIDDGVVVGDRTMIGAGVYVGQVSVIGKDCLIYPRVTIRERTRLGDRVILHIGVALGADGFGFENVGTHQQKIPQVGTVEIGDDVEIGANSSVDRGRFGKTRIGRGTKIDNLVQIGHNCMIGEHCIICGLVGMAGSTVLGNRVTIAGQVGLAGHLTVGDGAIVAAQAGVTKDIPAGAVVVGSPAVPHMEFKRETAALHRLPELTARVRALEKLVADLRDRLEKA